MTGKDGFEWQGRNAVTSPEFREEAAKMVVDTSRFIAEAAREPGLNGSA